ncbi:DUF6461 domain-containing protein [Nonomuraea aridisoli]|uniref:Uncharacterized protein n=1 Tax=Nonomuraea aridisoli TaxID=2070368 RepID=A0A2W2F5U5_9ACTN|nr:DUF6461 domain-containing protein [Nonomuraea aridisoli]PZG23515.1 hypothetical protein C1J01_00920 [Nonomuraea aridisoli]
MINYYVQLLKDLDRLDPYINNAMFWMVVRGRAEPLTVTDVAHRLDANLDTAIPRTVLEPGREKVVVLEQSGHDVIVLAANAYISDPDIWTRLTENAQAWGFWWLVNNTNRLFYAADGDLITKVDVFRPSPAECTGRNPRALDDYLGAIRALVAQREADDRAGAFDAPPYPRYPHWEAALATVEAMTGVRLDLDRFTRKQLSIQARGL